MTENKYLKGSEWRKWDLHIHTPETKLNNNYKNNWSEFLKKISTSDIEVFGVNDYFSFDGFFNLHTEIEKLKTKDTDTFDKIKHKIFFPTIELRLKEVDKSNKHTNIHIIFNEKMKNRDALLEGFLSKLKLSETDGQFCDKNVTYSTDYTTIGAIQEAIKNSNINDQDYLIVVPINGYGNARNFDITKTRTNKTLEPIRNYCHFFFGDKENNDFTIKNYQKPALFCSDAHSLEDIAIWNTEKSKGFTWIKSDSTFDGLKQILYEYEDRVKIQEERPDKKEDYNIIDFITIKQKANTDTKKIEEKIFETETIFFNQNMTSIIGEKSSGKSLLLYLIAKSLLNEKDLENIDIDKNSNAELVEKYKDLIDKVDIIVKYRNGSEFKINQENKNITYIPQNYLNKSVEKSDSIDFIKKKMLNIFERNNPDLEEKKAEYNEKIKEIEKIISNNIDLYFSRKSDIEQLNKNLFEIGASKDDLEKNIKEKEEQLKVLLSQFKDIKEGEIDLYTTTSINIESFKKINNNFLILQNNLNNINFSYLELNFKTFKDNIRNNTGSDILCNCLDSIYKNAEKEFNIKKEEQKNIFIEERNKLNIKIKENEEKISHIKLKIENQKELTEKKLKLENEIKVEKEKLEKIKNLLNLIKETEEEKSKSNSLIKDSFKKFYIISTEFCNEYNGILKNNESDKIDSIDSIELELNFDHQLYKDKLLDIFDGRGGNNFNQFYYDYNFSVESYEEHFSNIANNKYNCSLKNGKIQKDILEKIYINFFKINLKIVYDGDEFGYTMSAGKIAILLLKLLIEFDKSNDSPILIDQPEDDLDNKSVVKHLVNFIKIAKKTRQIILVSHNANIVMNGDSEEIIVAKQNNKMFFYESGSIENQNIRKEICDIMEGGNEAFKNREKKYNINNK